MASNVITFIAVTALACLASVSGQLTLPSGTYCTTSDNLACTQRYPNSVCNLKEVCKFGTNCVCPTGYAQYSFYNSTSGSTDYSCRPATVPVGGNCSNQVGNTCAGYRTSCQPQSSVCVCDSGYTPKSDGTDCVPLSLGQNCASGRCGVNAYCDSTNTTLCRCYPGYKSFDGTECTHYVPGEACPVTECEFVNSQSCGYGTCKNGVFECIPGSRWWQYSTPNGEEPIPLVDGECLKNTVTLVSTGELCDNSQSEYACRSTRCVRCPEQDDVYICNGATSSKTISAATSLILLLACYLFH